MLEKMKGAEDFQLMKVMSLRTVKGLLSQNSNKKKGSVVFPPIVRAKLTSSIKLEEEECLGGVQNGNARARSSDIGSHSGRTSSSVGPAVITAKQVDVPRLDLPDKREHFPVRVGEIVDSDVWPALEEGGRRNVPGSIEVGGRLGEDGGGEGREDAE
ncbi:hypothetical protein HDU90_008993 [Geranomyces variabilis]|nr:hypothetical protein HDU90_008993 [Geranomyces variabilis]